MYIVTQETDVQVAFAKNHQVLHDETYEGHREFYNKNFTQVRKMSYGITFT